jgi:hypothetical protein
MKKITRQIRLTHQIQDSYHENLITKLKKININKLNQIKKFIKKIKTKNKRKKQLYNIIQYNNNYNYNYNEKTWGKFKKNEKKMGKAKAKAKFSTNSILKK